mgnify:CR=1 FL=1
MDHFAWSRPRIYRVRTLRVAVTAVVIVVSAAVVSADALWDHAIEMLQASKHLVPASVVTRIEEMNADGRLRSTQETHIRFQVINDELIPQIISKIQNGETIDPETIDGATNASAAQFSEVFDADLASISAATRDGQQRTIRGQKTINYRIEEPIEQYTLKGQLWISEQGVPLDLEYTVDPLPRAVRRLVIHTSYYLQDGYAVIGEMVTEVAVNVSIFFRRLYRISVRSEDYFDPNT